MNPVEKIAWGWKFGMLSIIIFLLISCANQGFAQPAPEQLMPPHNGIIKFCVYKTGTEEKLALSKWWILAPNGRVYVGFTENGCAEVKLPAGTALVFINDDQRTFFMEVVGGELRLYAIFTDAPPYQLKTYLPQLSR